MAPVDCLNLRSNEIESYICISVSSFVPMVLIKVPGAFVTKDFISYGLSQFIILSDFFIFIFPSTFSKLYKIIDFEFLLAQKIDFFFVG